MGCGASTHSSKTKTASKYEEGDNSKPTKGGKTQPAPIAVTTSNSSPLSAKNGNTSPKNRQPLPPSGTVTVTMTTNRKDNFQSSSASGANGSPKSEGEDFHFTDFVLDNAYLEDILKRDIKSSGSSNGISESGDTSEFRSPFRHTATVKPNVHEIARRAVQRNTDLQKNGIEFSFGDFALVLTEDIIDRSVMEKANYDLSKMTTTEVYRTSVRKRVLQNFTLETFVGHKSRIKSARISPDDSKVLSCGSEDRCVTLTDLVHRMPVLSFDGHDDVIMDFWLSTDMKTVVTASRDNTIMFWDALTAKKHKTIESASLIIFVRLSPRSDYVLAGFQDTRAIIYDASSAEEKLVFSKHTTIVTCGNFSIDSMWTVTGSVNSECYVWNTLTGVVRCTLKGHQGAILHCMFSSDNNAVLTNDDRLVRVWDPRGGHPVLSLPIEGSPVTHGIGPGDEGNTAAGPQGARDKNALKYLISSYVAGNFIFIGRSNRRISLLDPNTMEEMVMLGVRANVHVVHSGSNSVVMGDINGNIYVLRLMLA